MNEPKPYHAMPVADVFPNVNSSQRGLSREEANYRLEKLGLNEIKKTKKRGKLKTLLQQFNTPIVYILASAAIISLVAGKANSFTVIIAVIFINGLVGFAQEVKADKAIDSLESMAAPEANVLRDCKSDLGCTQFRIPASEIVPGDVILLEAGDKVPADARIFEIANFQVDEAILTGESVPSRKIVEPVDSKASLGDRKNSVFAGTLVIQGRARAVVTGTGMNTELGNIASLLQDTKEVKTPLEKRVMLLTKTLSIIAFAASGGTFLAGLLRGFDIFELLVFSIATLVSAIPSGLPAVITITLAIGVSRMAKRNAIIRKLKAIDSLGAITAIVSDKTGTLTTNQMMVRKVAIDDKEINITGTGFTPHGEFMVGDSLLGDRGAQELDELLLTALLCTDANVREHKIAANQFKWEAIGDPTEGALVVAAMKRKMNKETLTVQYPRQDEIPFDPKQRFMATFTKVHDGEEGKVRVNLKGAPEAILALCDQTRIDGRLQPIDEKCREEIKARASRLAFQGFRILGMAMATIESPRIAEHKEKLTSNEPFLQFLGLAAIIDPPRDEVKMAIQKCKDAGIKVFMATGDHVLTASAIGKELGIIATSNESMEGVHIEPLDDSGLDAALERTRILARVSPEHKYRVVQALKRKGNVVGMTGDGANDAPALKVADVGVAMGITGTDVTKEASDMILTDDNFASIVNAVEEGRVVFENIKKGVRFLLTTNVGEVITIIISLFILTQHTSIFTPIMILWVNLVTDGSLTVALASEPMEGDIMTLPPKDPKEKIIDKEILISVLVTSVIMATSVVALFVLLWDGDFVRGQTIAFTSLAFLQIFNALNCRSRRESLFTLGFKRNRGLATGLVLSFSAQMVAIYVPFFNGILETTPLTALDLLVIALFGISLIVVDEVRKRIVRGGISRIPKRPA